MAHKCNVVRVDGKYHLTCETCGLITAQPANRGGLIARGERHEASSGTLGGPKRDLVMHEGRMKIRLEQTARLTEQFEGEPIYGVAIVDPEPRPEIEVVQATKGDYRRPAFQQAMFDDKCMQCGGPLKDPTTGNFCTTKYPVKAVCRGCKNGVAA